MPMHLIYVSRIEAEFAVDFLYHLREKLCSRGSVEEERDGNFR